MDSKEPQQGTTYILRPDTVVELPDTENTYNRFVRIYDRLGQYITDLDLEAFNRGFVEFDEDAIRKKVTEMINTAYKIGYIHDTSYLSDLTVDDALEICVDAILRITTGETLGRKQ